MNAEISFIVSLAAYYLFRSLIGSYHKQRLLRIIKPLHGAFGGKVLPGIGRITHAFRYQDHDFAIILSAGNSWSSYDPDTRAAVNIIIYPKIQNADFTLKRKIWFLTLLKTLHLHTPRIDNLNNAFYAYGNVPDNIAFAFNDPALTTQFDTWLFSSQSVIYCNSFGLIIAQNPGWPWKLKHLLSPAIIKQTLEQLIAARKKLAVN